MLAILFGLLAYPALAQSRSGTTFEAFGGGSYGHLLNESSDSAYGWEASISQYPYEGHRWIGGTIEASGLYTSQNELAAYLTAKDSVLTFMAGPTFAAPARHRIRPFAHGLLGAVLLRERVSGVSVYEGTNGKSSDTLFGSALGGGLDLPLTYRLAVRGQADWLTYKQRSGDRVNDLRASVGVVLKF